MPAIDWLDHIVLTPSRITKAVLVAVTMPLWLPFAAAVLVALWLLLGVMLALVAVMLPFAPVGALFADENDLANDMAED